MNKSINKLLLSLLISASILVSNSFAHAAEEANAPRRGLATIIFSGLGGAVLGLSTLSFYGKPQEKLNNISIGFAVGVILGTGYVAYQAATTTAYTFEQSVYQVATKVPYLPANPHQVYNTDPTLVNYTFDF